MTEEYTLKVQENKEGYSISAKEYLNNNYDTGLDDLFK